MSNQQDKVPPAIVEIPGVLWWRFELWANRHGYTPIEHKLDTASMGHYRLQERGPNGGR